MDCSSYVRDLRARLDDVTPLEGEEDFVTADDTIVRFLKAREWNLDEAEKLLRMAVDWRREMKPQSMDCRWCHETPGYHSMRQVGFDKIGRPVIYSCFAQSSWSKYCIEDVIAHVTYINENAKRTMLEDVQTWVFVLDFTGMTLPACNPKLGYGMTQILSNYYPERLGLVICVNHSAIFQGIFNAIKVFVQPNTVAKCQLVRSKRKYTECFKKYFSEELTRWLINEIKANKREPFPLDQREFWSNNKPDVEHDPRGTASYIRDYVDKFRDVHGSTMGKHKPHPNIVDTKNGRRLSATTIDQSNACETNDSGGDEVKEERDSGSELGDVPGETDLPEEYRVPVDAQQINMES